MLDDDNVNTETLFEAAPAASPTEGQPAPPAKKTAAKRAAKKTTRKSAAKKAASGDGSEPAAPTDAAVNAEEGAPTAAKKSTKKVAAKKAAAAKKTTKKAATKTTAAKKTATKAAEDPTASAETSAGQPAEAPSAEAQDAQSPATEPDTVAATAGAAVPLFQPPAPVEAPSRSRRKKSEPAKPEEAASETAADSAESAEQAPQSDRDEKSAEEDGEQGGSRRRRRRGGRRRRKSGDGGHDDSDGAENADAKQEDAKGSRDDKSDAEEHSEGSSRRRRRRRRAGEETETSGDEPHNTVTRVRQGRSAEDEITALTGSTRLEAKRQRRREGREAGRRRAPIVSEAEFLARREAVDRVMVIRQKKDLTQIAVLEDKVLVEHYVARESQTSLIGNVYLGRVQNVLPSMEAAFIDIGKGRNAVLYAGEVNWEALGSKDGNRKIEQVLKSGQTVLVQVTKDPIGHKGARLTSQIALPGRFLVYVPDGTTSGISRKLPDTERNRLKTLLKQIVPDSAGVIVRTAAEGASEEELTRDVERLTARWNDISAKVEKGNAPQLLYGEPDLTLKVVRDLFTEDFGKLVVSGDDAWDMVDGYVQHVAPDLAERLERYDGGDVFADYRIDEQIAKGVDRKVWLPSGGSLIIDRTEAMTVVDVNTGKFTGSGGNLEETVTKNNLEAAEEIVRQLRLRDIGGIIVVDFIDMVLESNRDLVLRRLVECLGRDRTRHQVAEVTSLGLVQMTRKRIGTGLLEAFSETCEHCQGRGLILHQDPVDPKKKAEEEPRRGRRGRSRGKDSNGTSSAAVPSPKDIAAMARPEAPAEADAESTGAQQADSASADAESADAGSAVAVPSTPGRSAKQPKSKASAAKQPETKASPAADEPAAPEGGTPAQTSSASESATPAAAGAESKSAASTQHGPAQPDEAHASAEQSDQAPRPDELQPQPVEPAAPKVVTRVRRRSSRPAGPPKNKQDGAAEAPAANGPDTSDGTSEAGTGTSEVAGGAADGSNGSPDGSGPGGVGHVPVKTKAGRRR